MGQNLAPEKITSILEKYSPPENCSEVTVTRVNPEIWAPLNAAQRKADLRMANLQQTLQKATFATVMATDKLFRAVHSGGAGGGAVAPARKTNFFF